MSLLAALIALPVLLLMAPALALLLLVLAALTGRGRADPDPPECRTVRVAVLVPAHNESTHVLPTITCVQAEMQPGDRLLVVADNCSDDTAALARAAGATVSERQHATLRGKGHALAHGVDQLRADPPDVVMILDADCVVTPGAVRALAGRAAALGRPVQMLNLMQAQPGSGLKFRLLEFAMRLKNQVRPLGAARLGGACHLMGTGMALPWRLIASAPLATGHIAEDMKLGVQLTREGHPAAFYAGGQVSSAFVTDAATARTQKSRWEHGHLQVIGEELPGLIAAALTRRSRALAVLALDLMIPPMAFYGLLLVGLLALTGLGALLTPLLLPAFGVTLAGAALFGLAVLLAWAGWARTLIRPTELLAVPLYMLWKLPVYVAYVLKRRSGWVRTKRD
jgi:cellulose synthase/poly-beta-1,6-N-acetylglucosamine synthase-like glycosyltransferase